MSADQKPPATRRPPRGQPLPSDDASSQALSEALGSSFLLVRILIVVLLIGFAFSCVFTVNPNEVAVVLRFGQPRGTGAEVLKKPGFHWAMPYPIDEIVRIRVGESQSVSATNAWYATTPDMDAKGIKPESRPSLTPGVDGHVLTSDGNILHVKARMNYHITDPLAYVFRFSNATNLLINALNNAVYHAAVTYKADAALYKDKEGFRQAVRGHLVDWLDRTGVGVAVDVLEVQVAAPVFVEESFDAVIKAEQARNARISQAQGNADEITRRAVGEAQVLLNEGMISSNALIASVSADADAFSKQLPHFQRSPELFKKRKLTETFAQVFTNATDKFFVEPGKELRLNLSREPLAPAKSANP
jgi:membrane protease subunit HflK